MRLVKSLLLASALLASTALTARADINVVASIKPVHSLVAAVMQGVGKPGLIVDGVGSPHTYAMKPSEAAMLQRADVVFWMGHELETFLDRPLESIAKNAEIVELLEAHGLVKLKLREGGTFEAHGHDDHADHDDHDHDKKAEKDHDDHDHDHDKKGHDDHDHDNDKKAKDDHDDHGHGSHNVHVWLDPVNAKALVHEIGEALSKADPANASKYEANAKSVESRLDKLTAEVSGELKAVRGKRFVMFHDAYHYFENRFGLKASGSITVSPEVMPGAQRIKELRAKVKELGAACVFSEPQFEPKLVATVTEGTSAKTGVLDPLGASIETGPDHYFKLIRNMSASFKACMAEAS